MKVRVKVFICCLIAGSRKDPSFVKWEALLLSFHGALDHGLVECSLYSPEMQYGLWAEVGATGRRAGCSTQIRSVIPSYAQDAHTGSEDHYDGKAGQLGLLELNGETQGVGRAGACPSLRELTGRFSWPSRAQMIMHTCQLLNYRSGIPHLKILGPEHFRVLIILDFKIFAYV